MSEGAAERAAGPVPGQLMTAEYVRAVARLAYLWGWPLANIHNRQDMMRQVPEPGLVGGFLPVAPLGRLAMLHDYVTPEQRMVACPNQDVVYGFGLLSAEAGPCVVQVPDFGDRFWVYQVVDQRTDSFARLGKMYGTRPGHYLLAPRSWTGDVPDGLAGEFRYDTAVGVCIPRVFMDDTDADRDAVQPAIDQITMYPLAEYTGRTRTVSWREAPTFPVPAGAGGGRAETRWVDPARFFSQLPDLLAEVPARPGEEALYGWFASLTDPEAPKDLDDLLSATAIEADRDLVTPLLRFRDIGIPLAHHWTAPRNGAAYGTDYLSRTAMARANIFVNAPAETAYFYQDLDETGAPLDGDHAYHVTFPAGGLPPVHGFWSLTLYNEHHFFAPNPIDRYSLGTKNKDLHYGADGSLTVTVRPDRPAEHAANWLPSPPGRRFSLYLRAYWPDEAVLGGAWTPPAVTPIN